MTSASEPHKESGKGMIKEKQEKKNNSLSYYPDEVSQFLLSENILSVFPPEHFRVSNSCPWR